MLAAQIESSGNSMKLTQREVAGNAQSFNDTGLINYLENVLDVYDVNMTELEHVSSYDNGVFSINTNKVIFTGKYENILRLLYQVESNKIAILTSTTWKIISGNSGSVVMAITYVKSISYENNG